jgi:hypothetical protein
VILPLQYSLESPTKHLAVLKILLNKNALAYSDRASLKSFIKFSLDFDDNNSQELGQGPTL